MEAPAAVARQPAHPDRCAVPVHDVHRGPAAAQRRFGCSDVRGVSPDSLRSRRYAGTSGGPSTRRVRRLERHLGEPLGQWLLLGDDDEVPVVAVLLDVEGAGSVGLAGGDVDSLGVGCGALGSGVEVGIAVQTSSMS